MRVVLDTHMYFLNRMGEKMHVSDPFEIQVVPDVQPERG